MQIILEKALVRRTRVFFSVCTSAWVRKLLRTSKQMQCP